MREIPQEDGECLFLRKEKKGDGRIDSYRDEDDLMMV